ncbi:MAG: Fic family protein [Bacteroidetes bacterium]|nr:Fic family protein [Bacteroidota bacterium]
MTISRYSSADKDEFQPGSRGRILRNRLGITRIHELEEQELRLYIECEERLLHSIRADQVLSIRDVNEIHRMFLGGLYDWAGTYRNVNLMKGGFPFAPARNIATLMEAFEREHLSASTPCQGNEREICEGIARVHAEFILIHPYREGNGRTARLLSTVMAWQADYPTLDFSFIGRRGKGSGQYIGAIHAAHAGEYEPMEMLMLRAMRGALRRFGGEK